MTQFSDWFKRAYKQWSRSQPGEEDFLAFCNLLGYPPAVVLGWLQGDSIPQGAELLNIAGLFGPNVYSLLGQPEPDPELMKIYNSFSHLSGESRSKLALALWEAQIEMQQSEIASNSDEAKIILREVLDRWGF